MKKNKLIFSLILLSLFFTSGCDVEYHLEMKNDTFEENFSFIGEKSEYIRKGSTSRGKEEMVDFLYPVETDVQDVQKKVLYESNYVKYKYNRRFQITEIEFWPSFSGMCFETLEALYGEDDTLILQSSPIAPCYNKYKELKNIFITFKTDYEVLETNGEKKEDNVYIWHFQREKPDDSIYIKVKYDKENISEKKETISSENKFSFLPILFWGFVIGITGFGIYFIVKRIYQNNRFD